MASKRNKRDRPLMYRVSDIPEWFEVDPVTAESLVENLEPVGQMYKDKLYSGVEIANALEKENNNE